MVSWGWTLSAFKYPLAFDSVLEPNADLFNCFMFKCHYYASDSIVSWLSHLSILGT